MQSVRALLLAVACSSLARVQSLTPREKYVQRMTDCQEPTKRPASCDEYLKRIKNISNAYNPTILHQLQSPLPAECYVYADKKVLLHVARKTCEKAGGLLPWFLNSEKQMLTDMFTNTKDNNKDVWIGLINNRTAGRYVGWKGMCPAKTGGLKSIKKGDIDPLFFEINDEDTKQDLGARCSKDGLKDRTLDDEYRFICMTVIRPPQTSSPPPPTSPQPTPTKGSFFETALIIGLVVLFVCLLGLTALLVLIMNKKKQKLAQAQKDAEQQEQEAKQKEKDAQSAGSATAATQSCYSDMGTAATETPTEMTMTPVMMPVHLGDTKEQCSGKKSCLCTMCRAKKEMLGEKIPEEEPEKGVVSQISELI